MAVKLYFGQQVTQGDTDERPCRESKRRRNHLTLSRRHAIGKGIEKQCAQGAQQGKTNIDIALQ